MLGAAGMRKDSAQPMMLINDSLINKGLRARVTGLCQSCGEGERAEPGGTEPWRSGVPCLAPSVPKRAPDLVLIAKTKPRQLPLPMGKWGSGPVPSLLLCGFSVSPFCLDSPWVPCPMGTRGARGHRWAPLMSSVNLVNCWELWQLLKATVGGRIML